MLRRHNGPEYLRHEWLDGFYHDTMTHTLNIQPVSPTIGAEVRGVDLSNLDDAMFEHIQRALHDNLVLVFPGQQMAPEDHLAFARRFGPVESPHPVFGHLEEHPEVSVVEHNGGKGVDNAEWHTDVTYRECPPLGSILYARELPEGGGDTLWASMYAAYEALSVPVRAMIDGLTAVHDILGGSGHNRGMSYRDYVLSHDNGREWLQRIEDEFPPVRHPVVRSHPATGRKGLFVNRSFTMRIDGLSLLESGRILEMLLEHVEQPRFQMRHSWRPDDVVMWDNRCTQHYAVNDYGEGSRLMH